MLEALNRADQALFLLLNGLHSPLTDVFWWHVSQTITWVPLYVGLIIWLWLKFRQKALPVVAALLLTVGVADQLSSSLMKPYFARLRPSHQPVLEGRVHLVREPEGGGLYRGGTYGFVSSHAANTFGIAALLVLLYGSRWRWLYAFFPWAALVSYSRLALGVHYPADLLCGALVGMACAWVSWKLWQLLPERVR